MQRNLYTWLYLAILIPMLWTAPPSATAAPLMVNADLDQQPLGQQLEILKDSSHAITLDEILSGQYEADFFPSQSGSPRFANNHDAYWARFSLLNSTEKPLQRLLVWPVSRLLDMSVFLPDEAGNYIERHSQVYPMVRDTDQKHRFFIYQLTLPPKSEHVIYLHADSYSIRFNLSLWKPSAFTERTHLELMFHGWLFGFVLAVIAYQLALFVMSRDPSYWSLLLFAGSGWLFQLISLGYHNLIMVESSGLLTLGFLAIQALFCAAVVYFSRVFLATHKRFPITDHILRLHQIGAVLVALISPLDHHLVLTLEQERSYSPHPIS